MHMIHTTSVSSCQTNLKIRIKSSLENDIFYKQMKENFQTGVSKQKVKDYNLNEEELLLFKGKLYIPNSIDLKLLILDKFHKKPYLGHLGYQTMISSIKKEYYCPKMKTEIVEYLVRCLKSQQVKAKHQHPTRWLQLLPISKWKWKAISMDFITGLSKTKQKNKKNDAIMLVVDKLSNATHFIPIKCTYKANIEKNFM